ncbi:copper chaperone PCu(A)C [Nocardioides zeae]|uniref:Copper chaperone PCu(A)C n=1 Tax=Nocardioides imazamoxiresistens TaxID=3231893 RepID=A0ABU3PVB1_9ACTN|nr:copper chaperone PCu(A)C [Nocardioides zeae]MDT9593178.1 copper chaperone PCu(A)C [Nocardioides zeae]
MHLPTAHTVLAVRSALVVGVLGLSTVLAACGSSSEDDSTPAASDSASAEAADASLTLVDPWIKATAEGEDMTAAFGTIVNDTDADITVVGASTEAAGVVELHEVVSDGSGGMLMQPKEGGFVVPAGGSHDLVAGGDHIMLMELSSALVSGDEVAVSLELEDGSTVDFTALVKPFTGADEEYAGGGHGGDESSEDHSDHEGHEGHGDHSGHEEHSDQ